MGAWGRPASAVARGLARLEWPAARQERAKWDNFNAYSSKSIAHVPDMAERIACSGITLHSVCGRMPVGQSIRALP